MSALRLLLIIRGSFVWPALSPTLFQTNESNMKISFLRLTLLPVLVRRDRCPASRSERSMRKSRVVCFESAGAHCASFFKFQKFYRRPFAVVRGPSSMAMLVLSCWVSFHWTQTSQSTFIQASVVALRRRRPR